MPNSCSSRKQQLLKIEEIVTTLAACGFVALDRQAYVLGSSRGAPLGQLSRGTHKASGLLATTINRMLATDHLPQRVRLKLLEYIAEKMSGAYGDQGHRLKAFASKISVCAYVFRRTKSGSALELWAARCLMAPNARRFETSSSGRPRTAWHALRQRHDHRLRSQSGGRCGRCCRAKTRGIQTADLWSCKLPLVGPGLGSDGSPFIDDGREFILGGFICPWLLDGVRKDG